MKKDRMKDITFPTLEQLEKELARENYRRRYERVLSSTIYALVAVAALAVLIATLVLPVLRIYGSSMTPTLNEGNIVIALRGSEFQSGDMIAFYYNNKILVKRVIAQEGQWVDMDIEGNVTIDGVPLDEPYLVEKAVGECNITLPYQVPSERFFVMGDHRSTSIDSRNTSVGCVAQDQVVGRIAFRVWPLSELGAVH